MNRRSAIVNYTVQQLRKAVAIREKIESLETQLAQTLGVPAAFTVGSVMRRRRKMSAAARAKISRAAKERWAKIKAARK